MSKPYKRKKVRRIKIFTNYSILRKQNYNLLNKDFNSLIIIFNTNKNKHTLIII